MSDFTERELLWIEQTLLRRIVSLIGKDGWMFNGDYVELSALHKKVLHLVAVSKEKE